MGSIELIVQVFDDEHAALLVLAHLQKMEKENRLKIYDAAALCKSAEGKVQQLDRRDIGAGRGALVGAVTGALVGLLGGPAGALVGAAVGAATGGIAAGKIDLGFSNHFLEGLRSNLKPGCSALLLLVEQIWAEPVMAELQENGGKLHRDVLKDEVVKLLEQA
jgi:uncharacterized membrane protein